MAARKRGKGGKFVKGGGAKGPKKAKHHAATPSHSGGGMSLSALHKLESIDRTVHRIEGRLVPKRVKERLARMHSSRAAQAAKRAAREHDEASLAYKYS
jgi:hypothetical protein